MHAGRTLRRGRGGLPPRARAESRGPPTHNNLAVALAEQRLFGSALAHYREALAGQPDYPAAMPENVARRATSTSAGCSVAGIAGCSAAAQPIWHACFDVARIACVASP